ncbi:chloramphenicol phosphotransferase CPT family protein [Pseudoroseicyclus tamaricis]|uniref:AAA family ATPase n=1 Tax=Pseudoroseicyclus tamaricis TaxID=2705421 RepID=A0A6B2JV18_9RHOB|nr:AAA family ATPase [Pseudoroseicyclus tamaricis]NDV01735.1 AAA family ATPase [Pseudoroseicyclus tamaricis]
MGGRLIFLHGASSSGKSTLARALQAALPEPFWHFSIDHLRDGGIVPMARFRSGEFSWGAQRQAFFDGFHGMVGAGLAAGNDMILEHILEAPDWRGELAERWAGVDLFYVGLRTPLEELERREAARGDRPAGMAAEDFGRVHEGQRYDLEVDGGAAPQENARVVIEAWERRGRSRFFEVGAV